MMKVAIASDHAGFALKEQVLPLLRKRGFEVKDFGTDSEESMDYPDTVKLAARSVASGESDRGIVMCGSGVGASIVANKINGIRAVMCMDEYTAEFSRRHNNSNVLVLAGRRRTVDDVERYLNIWFDTEYEGGRHQNRLDKITEIEKEERQNG